MVWVRGTDWNVIHLFLTLSRDSVLQRSSVHLPLSFLEQHRVCFNVFVPPAFYLRLRTLNRIKHQQLTILSWAGNYTGRAARAVLQNGTRKSKNNNKLQGKKERKQHQELNVYFILNLHEVFMQIRGVVIIIVGVVINSHFVETNVHSWQVSYGVVRCGL